MELTREQKLIFLKSSEFVVARHRPEFGGYYSIYKKDNSSPTGRSLAFGLSISEWEELSKEAGKSNQYMVKGEKD